MDAGGDGHGYVRRFLGKSGDGGGQEGDHRRLIEVQAIFR
jgi:hypothetical protein